MSMFNSKTLCPRDGPRNMSSNAIYNAPNPNN